MKRNGENNGKHATACGGRRMEANANTPNIMNGLCVCEHAGKIEEMVHEAI